jgi:hypothetical protein
VILDIKIKYIKKKRKNAGNLTFTLAELFQLHKTSRF